MEISYRCNVPCALLAATQPQSMIDLRLCLSVSKVFFSCNSASFFFSKHTFTLLGQKLLIYLHQSTALIYKVHQASAAVPLQRFAIGFHDEEAGKVFLDRFLHYVFLIFQIPSCLPHFPLNCHLLIIFCNVETAN